MLSPSAPPMQAVENLSYTWPEVIPLPAPKPPARFAPQHIVNVIDADASSSSQPQVVYFVGTRKEKKEEMDWCTECGLRIFCRVIGGILVLVVGFIIFFVVRAVK